MELHELLKQVIHAFDALKISCFVTGSVASMYYGEPRLTNDIDFVADLRLEHMSAFCKFFSEEEFYLSEEAVMEAVRNH